MTKTIEIAICKNCASEAFPEGCPRSVHFIKPDGTAGCYGCSNDCEYEQEGMGTYYVMTPEYGEVVPILDDGTGPIEWGRDVEEVKATTKREAKQLGYQELKRQHWFRDHYDHDKHPYAYLTVEGPAEAWDLESDAS